MKNTATPAVSEPVEIFRGGKQTDSAGKTKEWTAADLDQIVSNFDAKDSAPMVIGHPKHDSPAWGWVQSLQREGDKLFARLAPTAKFREWADAGHIRNRSVKIVSTPKGYKLGHVGFLGAAPPAVEGLEALTFNADEPGEIYEFGWKESLVPGALARALRGLREFLVGEWGLEKADRALPGYPIEQLEQIAADERAAASKPASLFATPVEDSPVAKTFTQEELDAAVASARAASDAEKLDVQNRLRAAEFAQRLADNRAFVQSIAADKDGNVRLTPAMIDGLPEALTFAQGLEASEFEFTAADNSAQKKGLYEFMKAHLSALPPVMKLGVERGGADHGVNVEDAVALERAASEFQANEAKRGVTISIAQAVTHVKSQGRSAA